MKLKDLLLEANSEPRLGIDFSTNGKIFNAKKKTHMTVVSSIEDMPYNTVYQKTDEEPYEVITHLKGNAKEAVAEAKKGDWIACGAVGEKWVIKSTAFDELYKISGNKAIPIQIKSFIEIKSLKRMKWMNACNEKKSIPAKKKTYYLMANTDKDLEEWNWKEINPMDVKSFNLTY